MDIIEKLEKLRLSKNMSVYRLAELSGINQSTLANTFSRRTVPSIKNLELMCDAMGITLSQFFLEDESYEILTLKEKELIKNYRSIDKNIQQSIFTLISDIEKKED